MISVQEASDIISSNLFIPEKEIVAIENCLGRVLAEAIVADRDFPSFDRATMDGIALDAVGFHAGNLSFKIEGIQAAGQPAGELTSNLNCFEIMTGAMLPEGTNTVVRYEDVEISNNIAFIKNKTVNVGENIHFRGLDAKQDAVLLEQGTKLKAAEVALLASVGKAEVPVKAHPRIAIISTGDELISIDESPLPYQIRMSNSYALQAALTEMGFTSSRFHLADDEQILKAELHELLLEHDVLILSGGVSKGKFDFIPTVLQSLGVEKLFHQVSQKPGKPMWFGKSEEAFVFALPGNPVSTFMCFHRYVKPWLQKSLGLNTSFAKSILAKDFSFKPSLTYFLQVKIENQNGKLMAYPLAGGGSGDFINLKEVDGFLELPADKNEFKEGEVYPLIQFR